MKKFKLAIKDEKECREIIALFENFPDAEKCRNYLSKKTGLKFVVI